MCVFLPCPRRPPSFIYIYLYIYICFLSSHGLHGGDGLTDSPSPGGQRNLHPQPGDTREQLLERVKANMRHMP